MLSQDAEMLNYSHAMPRACGQAEREAVAEKTASLAVSWRDMEILALLLITIGAFFYFMNVHIGEQSYELQQIRTEIISLEKGNEAARLEVARLESPARIQHIAETRLGMHVPHRAIYGGQEPVVDQKRIRE